MRDVVSAVLEEQNLGKKLDQLTKQVEKVISIFVLKLQNFHICAQRSTIKFISSVIICAHLAIVVQMSCGI
jgi:hypothetical protein